MMTCDECGMERERGPNVRAAQVCLLGESYLNPPRQVPIGDVHLCDACIDAFADRLWEAVRGLRHNVGPNRPVDFIGGRERGKVLRHPDGSATVDYGNIQGGAVGPNRPVDDHRTGSTLVDPAPQGYFAPEEP